MSLLLFFGTSLYSNASEWVQTNLRRLYFFEPEGLNLTDFSPEAQNATLLGSPNTPTTEPEGLDFDGNDLITVPIMDSGISEFTIITLYAIEGGSGSRALATASDLSPNRIGYWHGTNVRLTFRVTNTAGDVKTLNNILFGPQLNNFRVMTACWKSGEFQRLILNDFEESYSEFNSVPTGNIHVGYDRIGGFSTSDSSFDGKIAAQAWYDRALTVDEIVTNYTAARNVAIARSIALTNLRAPDPTDRILEVSTGILADNLNNLADSEGHTLLP